MTEPKRQSTEELILEVLREVLARQEQQVAASQTLPAPPAPPPPAPRAEPLGLSLGTKPRDEASPPLPSARRDIDPETGLARAKIEQLEMYEQLAREPVINDIGARRLLSRLLVGVFLALILVNIPLVKGLPLARALPDSRALVIRDGLLLKGSGPEIYVLQDNHKRWISSLDAFAHFGYRWENVHEVEDEFLARFPDGPALHVLLKCDASPHIYRLENDRKRWLRDIATFQAEGHVWEDVRIVDCAYLRSLADGPPIPPDAGPPPQP